MPVETQVELSLTCLGSYFDSSPLFGLEQSEHLTCGWYRCALETVRVRNSCAGVVVANLRMFG